MIECVRRADPGPASVRTVSASPDDKAD